MKKLNSTPGNEARNRTWLLAFGATTIAVSSVIMVNCSSDNPAITATTPTEPPPLDVAGTSLYCDPATIATDDTKRAVTLSVADPDSIAKHNISFDAVNDSWNNHNAGNNLKRLSAIVLAQKPDGTEAKDPGPDGIEGTADDVSIGDVHPLIVSYGEQVIGEFEGGDGSADIGDPDNVDDIFVSLSLDNGISWKKEVLGDTADKSSTQVTWDGQLIDYPGHSHKPTMHIQGDKILVAWNDKYCPSGNPFELEDPATEDYYQVNGSQGSIDYGGIVAPNDKLLYEVPYSCVWTARGVFGDHDSNGIYEVEWRQTQQLTSGTRDTNKIWIAPAEVGFAISWQEDPEGLRSGKGAGPGEGYSGATTNHGSDIWYTYITMDDFDDVCAENDTDCDIANAVDDPAVIAGFTTKPKPAVNFTYPVRITNNEICSPGDNKLYCADHCFSTVTVQTNNQTNTDIQRCVDDDIDYLTADASIAPEAAVLDGDTGASRPALKILKTNAAEPEYVAILAYEETKGLSESDPQDQGDSDTDIALEGKVVYFESFLWDQPVDISAGRIVNLHVPEADVAVDGTVTLTGLDIYENARRVVILNQVDACEMTDGDPTFALMYKQGFETQGGPSDMFVRVNKGFTYDDFEDNANNVSAHDNTEVNGDGTVVWDSTYLDDQSYDNPFDNTFSPRGWLRGGEIYTGFEYSPLWRATTVGTVPNNFWIHRYAGSTWQGPMQISLVTGAKVSTLDPRFIPTPKGSATSLLSDESNPDVIFLSYGTFDMQTGEELDLFYTRSTDKGTTWEYIDLGGNPVVTDAGIDGIPGTADDAAARLAKLAAKSDIHEMEVQALASPDGTLLFDAWLEETAGPVTEADASQRGLESRFGMVEYE